MASTSMYPYMIEGTRMDVSSEIREGVITLSVKSMDHVLDMSPTTADMVLMALAHDVEIALEWVDSEGYDAYLSVKRAGADYRRLCVMLHGSRVTLQLNGFECTQLVKVLKDFTGRLDFEIEGAGSVEPREVE